jgi:hypothetical protein
MELDAFKWILHADLIAPRSAPTNGRSEQTNGSIK